MLISINEINYHCSREKNPVERKKTGSKSKHAKKFGKKPKSGMGKKGARMPAGRKRR